MKPNEYKRGFKDAGAVAIAHLHALACEMNDPRARQVLNSAAVDRGLLFKREADRMAAHYMARTTG